MNIDIYSENEHHVLEAFNRQSAVFDHIYSSNKMIDYKRRRVRDHIMQFLKPDSNILELNSGTGEDAIYFAKHGHHIHATDISSGMLQILEQKVILQRLTGTITFENCSYISLEKLKDKGPYDLIFSNFAGINCTNQLDSMLDSLPALLKPGGMITLVFLPPFCLWEFLMLFKGKFRTSFRRFCGVKGAAAHIEGVSFRCWYYKPSHIIKKLKPGFHLLGYEGLCTVVPPSYMDTFADKHPHLYNTLKGYETKLKDRWPWRNAGDYVILSFQKK